MSYTDHIYSLKHTILWLIEIIDVKVVDLRKVKVMAVYQFSVVVGDSNELGGSPGHGVESTPDHTPLSG